MARLSFFDFQPLGPPRLSQILALEAGVLEQLERPDLLRRNSAEMWERCLLPPHMAVGAFADGRLAAVAVLFVPQEDDGEALAPLLEGVETAGLPSANYKICIVHPDFRGHGLQQTLGNLLEEAARRQGIALLCSTVSPHNAASIRSLEKLGYQFDRTLTKYGYPRNLYYKMLSQGAIGE